MITVPRVKRTCLKTHILLVICLYSNFNDCLNNIFFKLKTQISRSALEIQKILKTEFKSIYGLFPDTNNHLGNAMYLKKRRLKKCNNTSRDGYF